ncbi:hypothetical protein DN730_09910 [Marinomonas piezotolerans]|uniref:Uncharacterized protein n=1 Tax=Marinomonas piezotolerans TaxID=2213058 RepID=A0A370UA96_9GAMM|nr:hypothetical protein [Marinomonas piezotolerans]RDL44690.1 hypothetical protein DN730_09910 [Marinomonas piezotolerans]
MSNTRHEFVLTASDRTKAAFASAVSSVNHLRQSALTASNLISTALGGVGVVAFTTEMADMGENALLASDRLNTTTEQITSLQYAASKFGVDGESMNGILQDMSVRIQEFATIGTGEGADFFETLSLDAKEFANLEPDQLLYRVAQELENVSDASARVYLDQLGGDNLVSLLPALRNGAAGLKELQQEAYDTNKVLSQIDAVRLGNIANEINIMKNSSKALSLQLAAEFEPAVKAIGARFKEFASDENAVSDTLDKLAIGGTLVASVYGGRMVSSLVASTQAKYADMIAARQSAAATLAEAEAGLANAQQKLTMEMQAHEVSIVEKRKEAAASELAAKADLDRLKASRAAAVQDVASAEQAKAYAAQLTHSKQRAEKLKEAEANLVATKKTLAATTKQVERAEQAHTAVVTRNAASIQAATDNTKALDRAKRNVEKSTKSLTKAQSLYNSTVKAGTVATRGLGAAMSFLGGPIGLLTMGVSTIAMLSLTSGEAAGNMNALNMSADELGETFKTSGTSDLEAMLQSVRGELAATSAAIEDYDNRKVVEGSMAMVRDLEKLAQKQNAERLTQQSELAEKEALITSELERRKSIEASQQAEIRKQILKQEQLANLETIRTSAQSAEQLQNDAHEKNMETIQAALASNEIDFKEAERLRESETNRHELAKNAATYAALQKRQSMFADQYTKEEQLRVEHEQRIIQYMQDSGINDRDDQRVQDFAAQSFAEKEKAYKDYKEEILDHYRDLNRSAVEIEQDRLTEELVQLKKYQADGVLSTNEYNDAVKAATEKSEKAQTDLSKREWRERLHSYDEFSNLFVDMQDSSSRELAAIGKAAALYNIGVRTAEGVMTAWATSMQLGPIVGPIVGSTLSAALIGYGLEQAGRVNSQTYHTGGIAGYDSDNYSQQLAQNEVPTILLRGEEVLTEQDPRHRNNLQLSRERSTSQTEGAVTNTVSVGDIYVTVPEANSSADQIAQTIGENIGNMVLGVINTRQGQKAVYSGVGAEARRNGGKIKGVS